MSTGDHSPTQPEDRVETLLAEREEYIQKQENLRHTKTTTEMQLLLSMIDERSVKDPFFVRQIRDTHVEEDSLRSFETLYDTWKKLTYEIERINTHQQRVELELAKCVLDTDEMVLADLDEAIEMVLTMRDE